MTLLGHTTGVKFFNFIFKNDPSRPPYTKVANLSCNLMSMIMTKSNDWIFSNTQLKILIIFADDARTIFVSNIRPWCLHMLLLLLLLLFFLLVEQSSLIIARTLHVSSQNGFQFHKNFAAAVLPFMSLYVVISV